MVINVEVYIQFHSFTFAWCLMSCKNHTTSTRTIPFCFYHVNLFSIWRPLISVDVKKSTTISKIDICLFFIYLRYDVKPKCAAWFNRPPIIYDKQHVGHLCDWKPIKFQGNISMIASIPNYMYIHVEGEDWICLKEWNVQLQSVLVFVDFNISQW